MKVSLSRARGREQEGRETEGWREYKTLAPEKNNERILHRQRERERGGIIEGRGISQMERRKRKERYEEEKRTCATHARASASEVCAFVLACLL